LVCTIGQNIITTSTKLSCPFGRVRINIWGYDIEQSSLNSTRYNKVCVWYPSMHLNFDN
jgi:hypothetical protein